MVRLKIPPNDKWIHLLNILNNFLFFSFSHKIELWNCVKSGKKKKKRDRDSLALDTSLELSQQRNRGRPVTLKLVF